MSDFNDNIRLAITSDSASLDVLLDKIAKVKVGFEQINKTSKNSNAEMVAAFNFLAIRLKELETQQKGLAATELTASKARLNASKEEIAASKQRIAAINEEAAASKAKTNEQVNQQKLLKIELANTAAKQKEATKTTKEQGEAISSLGGHLKTATALGKLFLASLIGDSISSFVKNVAQAQSQLEAFRRTLTGLLGSDELGGRLFDDLAVFIKKTPFTFQSTTDSVQKLVAAFKAVGQSGEYIAQNTIPTLTSLGNSAAALGGGDRLNRLVYAFTQVQAAGRLMGTEVRQITETGFPILAVLAETTGIKISEMSKAISQGKISFEMFQKAMLSAGNEGGVFANMMQIQVETVSGIFGNLQDTVFLSLGKIGEYYADSMKGFLNWSMKAIESMIGSTSAIERTTSGIKALIGVYVTWTYGIKALIAANAANTASLVAGAAAATANTAATGVNTLFVGTNSAAKKAHSLALASNNGVQVLNSTVTGANTVLLGTNTAAQVTATTTTGFLTVATTALATAGRAVQTAWASNPIGIIVLALGAAYVAYQAWSVKTKEIVADLSEEQKAVQKEIYNLGVLESAIFDVTTKTEDRNSAMNTIKKLYPEYFIGLGEEKLNYYELKKILVLVNEQLSLKMNLMGMKALSNAKDLEFNEAFADGYKILQKYNKEFGTTFYSLDQLDKFLKSRKGDSYSGLNVVSEVDKYNGIVALANSNSKKIEAESKQIRKDSIKSQAEMDRIVLDGIVKLHNDKVKLEKEGTEKYKKAVEARSEAIKVQQQKIRDRENPEGVKSGTSKDPKDPNAPKGSPKKQLAELKSVQLEILEQDLIAIKALEDSFNKKKNIIEKEYEIKIEALKKEKDLNKKSNLEKEAKNKRDSELNDLNVKQGEDIKKRKEKADADLLKAQESFDKTIDTLAKKALKEKRDVEIEQNEIDRLSELSLVKTRKERDVINKKYDKSALVIKINHITDQMDIEEKGFEKIAKNLENSRKREYSENERYVKTLSLKEEEKNDLLLLLNKQSNDRLELEAEASNIALSDKMDELYNSLIKISNEGNKKLAQETIKYLEKQEDLVNREQETLTNYIRAVNDKRTVVLEEGAKAIKESLKGYLKTFSEATDEASKANARFIEGLIGSAETAVATFKAIRKTSVGVSSDYIKNQKDILDNMKSTGSTASDTMIADQEKYVAAISQGGNKANKAYREGLASNLLDITASIAEKKELGKAADKDELDRQKKTQDALDAAEAEQIQNTLRQVGAGAELVLNTVSSFLQMKYDKQIAALELELETEVEAQELRMEAINLDNETKTTAITTQLDNERFLAEQASFNKLAALASDAAAALAITENYNSTHAAIVAKYADDINSSNEDVRNKAIQFRDEEIAELTRTTGEALTLLSEDKESQALIRDELSTVLKEIDDKEKVALFERQKEYEKEKALSLYESEMKQWKLKKEVMDKKYEADVAQTKMDRALAAVQVGIQVAIMAAKVIASMSSIPIVGVALGIAAAAVAAVGMYALMNKIGGMPTREAYPAEPTMPSFYDGIDDTSTIKGKVVDRRGGKVTILHPNETVFNARETAKMAATNGGRMLTRDEIVELVISNKSLNTFNNKFDNEMLPSFANIPLQNNSDVVNEMKGFREDMKALASIMNKPSFTLNWDRNGANLYERTKQQSIRRVQDKYNIKI